MKKSEINFIIDVLMFLFMAAIIGVVLLIKFVLLSGHQRWEVYKQNVDLTFWGLDRHQWGTIHLILAGILIILLILHIVLHWKNIVSVYKRFLNTRRSRNLLGILYLLILILLMVFPFFINIEIDKSAGRHNRPNKEHQSLNRVSEKHSTNRDAKIQQSGKKNKSIIAADAHQHHPDIEVKGFMTLQEVSDKHNIACDTLINKLNLPENTNCNTKLGKLRKKYGFTMSKIENVIIEFRKQKNINRDD